MPHSANVRLFVFCQALTMSIPAFVVFAGGIIGRQLAPDPAYATLPVALFMFGSAGSILPLVLAMQRFGRKPIFVLASAIACCGGVLAMVALANTHFGLYNSALVLMGIGLAAGQQYRFAAMESVAVEAAAGAAARVLLGGLVAAFLGPQLVPWLVRRIAVTGLIALGLAAMTGVLVIVFAHFAFVDYWLALVLLGLGWNFLFIGGTTLLAGQYRPAEAFRVQAVNDVTLFGLQALAALSAGWLLAVAGWQTLLLCAVPFLLLTMLGLLNWRLRRVPIALDPV